MESFYSPINPSKPFGLTRELLVVDGFLSIDTCQRLATYANWCPRISAPVGFETSGGNVENKQSRGFVADRIEFSSVPGMREECLAMVDEIYRVRVKDHYSVDIEWFEYPHILRYGIGGTYHAHSDSENWNPRSRQWVKEVDRDYSSIIYLGSDFKGGVLGFPNLNLRIKPQPGMMVTFPSDHRFLHGVEPIISGERYALVTWAAKRNATRVMKEPPPNIIYL